MKIRLATIGKIGRLFAAAASEYERRIRRYIPFEVVSLKDEEPLIDSTHFLILCDEGGAKLTSMELARLISKMMNDGKKEVVFAVGDAEGFSKEAKERADLLLSISNFTLQHDISAIVMLEQIYRAFTIIKGEPYHR